jgi:hypothetical protein
MDTYEHDYAATRAARTLEERTRELTRRWSNLLVGTWTGQAVILITYVAGSFCLAFLAGSNEDPTTALAALFLLATVSGFGWLSATYFQEIADSIQTFHADALMGLGQTLAQTSDDNRVQVGYQFVAAGMSADEAASARHINHSGVLGALFVRGLVFIVPPVAGWASSLYLLVR